MCSVNPYNVKQPMGYRTGVGCIFTELTVYYFKLISWGLFTQYNVKKNSCMVLWANNSTKTESFSTQHSCPNLKMSQPKQNF
jgi:hypothetical protein